MKRIISYRNIFGNLLCAAMCGSIGICIIGCCDDQFVLLEYFLGLPLIAVAISFIAVPFAFPNYISYDDSKLYVSDCPFFARKNFYEKRGGQLRWVNGNVFLSEVECVEIVTLSKKEEQQFVGYNHMFNKYLKVYIKYSNLPKYIYISRYSNAQIKIIISVLNDRSTGDGAVC